MKKELRKSIVVVAIMLAAGCANQSKESSVCPKRLDGFTNGVSTERQIKACLGNPNHEDHNPDGRFVYLYNLKNDITVTYLFDSKGVLTRTNAYKKN